MSLESVDLVKREVPLAERLDAFHDVEQPAARLRRFVSEEKRLLPFREHQVLCANDAGLNDMNLAGLRDAAEQDIGPDPARAASGFRSSMISRTKKCFGTMNRLTTASDLRSYFMRNKFGLLLAASRSHFVLKAPSTTLVPNLPF